MIASVFYRAGIIEQWDTGTLKIIYLCRDITIPPSRFGEGQSGSVVVTFRPAPGIAATATPQVAPQVTVFSLSRYAMTRVDCPEARLSSPRFL